MQNWSMPLWHTVNRLEYVKEVLSQKYAYKIMLRYKISYNIEYTFTASKAVAQCLPVNYELWNYSQ